MERARNSTADLPVVFPEVVFQQRALISKGMSFERWLELGKILAHIESAVQFYIGDYLNIGEKAYGEKYSQAVDEKQAQLWTHYAWVARSVAPCLRKHDLSYKHYEAVASLDENDQERWLSDAVKNKWGVHQLRERIRLFRKPEPKMDWHETGDGPEVVPDAEPQFEEMEGVRSQSYYPEYPERIGDLTPPPARVNIEADFNRLLGICRALRIAEKQGNGVEAVRQRTALDFFIAEHHGRGSGRREWRVDDGKVKGERAWVK